MSHTPERRAEQQDECEIATRIELAERLAVAFALTNISPIAAGTDQRDAEHATRILCGEIRCPTNTIRSGLTS